MTGFDIQRTKGTGRLSVALAIVATVGLLAGCGPGQGSSSTTVVLTGPRDKVQALMDQHKLLARPVVKAQVEPLEGDREKVTLNLPRGLPLGEVIGLGQDAAKAGVSYEFLSGSQWGSQQDPQQSPETSPRAAPADPPPAGHKPIV